MSSGRNADKHTTSAIVEENIVAHMRKWRCGRSNPLSASRIGKAGFPDYDFRSRQGAALAVARILRGMRDRGVVRLAVDGQGYYLTELG